MSKKLRGLIECYGDKIRNAQNPVFYHGVSHFSKLNKFETSFYGITSTTKQIEVLCLFMNDDGCILELEMCGDKNIYSPSGTSGDLRYFNSSLVSCYQNEEERIFFGGSYKMQYKTVRLMKPQQNLSHFIHSLTNFDHILNGVMIQTVEKKDFLIINELMNPSSA
eukprot:265297_1